MASWVPTLLFGIVGLSSVFVLVLDHRRVESTLEATVARTDNLAQTRLHVAQALLAAERLRAGDPTVPASRSIAELDAALDLLDDLIEGRSSLLDMRARPLESSVSELASEYATTLRQLRVDMESATFGDQPVADRLRIGAIEDAARSLEREVYGNLRLELAEEELRHGVRLLAWVTFILTVGAAYFTALRARERSDLLRRAVEKRYSALATHAAAQLVRTDVEGRVLEAIGGGRESTGMLPPKIVGLPWWTALPQGERERAAELWKARGSRSESFYLEIRSVDPDGRARWIGSRWARDTDYDGISWVGTLVDRTEHREVQDRLRQVQNLESVGHLASGIAHDFNNYLSVILLNLDLLQQDRTITPDARPLVDDIERAARDGRALVNRLMSLSRKSSLEMVIVGLGDVVHDAVLLARRLLGSDIALEVEVQDAPVVHADPRAVQEVLLNLLSNARDAMPGGGRVRIRVDAVDVAQESVSPGMEPGPFGRITVSDTGTGMDATTLKRIFDPFFTTKREGHGTGLGLAMVDRIVRQHGGYVHAYSEPGRGTTISVYLPRAGAGKALLTPQAEPAPAEPYGREKLRLLLVEDDEVLRSSAKRLLVRMGHDVTEASSGREALSVLDDRTFDVVISDLAMDDMNGLELLEAMGRRGRSEKFVLTSGYSAHDIMDRAALPNDLAYLSKPWMLADVERVLKRVV